MKLKPLCVFGTMDTLAMENGIAVSQKTINRITIWSSKATSGYKKQGLEEMLVYSSL